jgi:hypothetical protein
MQIGNTAPHHSTLSGRQHGSRVNGSIVVIFLLKWWKEALKERLEFRLNYFFKISLDFDLFQKKFPNLTLKGRI